MMENPADTGPPGTRKPWLAPFLLVVGVLSVRLAAFSVNYAADPSRVRGQDTWSYENPARALVEVGRLAVSPELPDKPETVRTPGYPGFLALIYLISGGSHAAAIVAQILVSGITIVCVYCIAYRLWGATAGFLSALIVSLDFPSFLGSQLLMTETLFAAFLTASVGSGVMLGAGGASRRRWAFLSGLFLAMATLVRPISYYLLAPILLGWSIHGWLAGWRRKDICVVILLIALSPIVLIGGWRLRNYRVSGNSTYAQIVSASALYYRAAGVLARRDGISFDEAKSRMKKKYPVPKAWNMLPPDTLKYYRREGWNIVRQHPVLFVRDQLRGLATVLFAPGTSTFILQFGLHTEETEQTAYGRNPSDVELVLQRLLANPVKIAATTYSTIYLLFVYSAALVSLWIIFRTERHALVVHVLIIGVIVYLLLLSSGPESGSRFRIPIVPLISLYAGRTAALLVDRYRAGRENRTRQGSSSCG